MGNVRNIGNRFGMLLLLMFLLAGPVLFAQEQPPIPIKVRVQMTSSLNFGTFAYDGGIGSVSVDSNNSRSFTGSAYPVSFGDSPTAAYFEVTANPGTIIRIQPEHNIELSGSNGGMLLLNIDSFSEGQTFIITPATLNTNVISVGGTLELGTGGSSPPGKYFGSFVIDFIHE